MKPGCSAQVKKKLVLLHLALHPFSHSNHAITHADLYNQQNISSTEVILLDSLGEALKLVDETVFFKEHTNTSVGSIDSERVIKLSFKLLQSPVPSLQLSAFQALLKVIPELVTQDKALIETENFDQDSLNLKKFEQVLAATQNIVNAMLLDFK